VGGLKSRELYKSNYFKLTQDTNRNGRRSYKISIWHMGEFFSDLDLESVRDLVDPFRNRAGYRAYSWKFNNRKDAEQYYTMLLMRWA
jgi:hypothetical protein